MRVLATCEDGACTTAALGIAACKIVAVTVERTVTMYAASITGERALAGLRDRGLLPFCFAPTFSGDLPGRFRAAECEVITEPFRSRLVGGSEYEHGANQASCDYSSEHGFLEP
jgi:hypothetical protein